MPCLRGGDLTSVGEESLSMALLIDGYNLLHAAGIFGRGPARSRLEASRLALLNWVAEHVPPGSVGRTTVVFDATGAPPGLPRVAEYRGMTVRFADRTSDADSLIEELIEAEPDPRRLTVVSSDHRLHRAARRRRATAVDSDVWYEQTARPKPKPAAQPGEERPPVPLLAEDVEYWIGQFGGPSALEAWLVEPPDAPADGAEPSAPAQDLPAKHTSDKPDQEELDRIGNPFPPGYGEDLDE